MLKSVVKLVLMFIGTALVAVVAAGASYIITKNYIEAESDEIKSRATVSTSLSEDETLSTPKTASETVGFDYYIVRLEGDALGVYASHDGKEEFLYNENIYTSNLTGEDITLLNTGVMLETSEALTGFIENFTS